jgi:hypothetical protein
MRSNLLNYRKNKRSQQEDNCIIILTIGGAGGAGRKMNMLI